MSDEFEKKKTSTRCPRLRYETARQIAIFPVNSSDFSERWAYTRGSLYTGSFGSRGFRGAYTRVLVR